MVTLPAGDPRGVLAISENGYGKRTGLDEYRRQSRGGKGILTLQMTPKTGPFVALHSVTETDDLMIVTEAGLMIRLEVGEIRTTGRNAQGVRLIHLRDGDTIADVTPLVAEDSEELPAEPAPPPRREPHDGRGNAPVRSGRPECFQGSPIRALQTLLAIRAL